jgi:hypothetical protein
MNDILIITAAAWGQGAAALATIGWLAQSRRATRRWRTRALEAETALESEGGDTAHWCATAEAERERADRLYRRLVRANALNADEKAAHFRKLGALGHASPKRRRHADETPADAEA